MQACSSVGPLGVGSLACERAPCELYCDLMGGVCPSITLEDEDGPTGADRGDCVSVCERLLPVRNEYTVPPQALLRSNDLNCRIQHINVALTFAAGTPSRLDHCLHGAGREGLAGRPCGPDQTGAAHEAAH